MTLRFMPYLLKIVVLAALYFGAAKVGLLFSFVEGNVTLVWPPTGIALAALLIFGYRLWPGVAVGVFLAAVSTGAPIGFVLIATVGNSLEALIGTYLLRHTGFDNSLTRVRDVVSLIILGAVFSTAVSAIFGVAGLAITGMASWSAYLSIWWHWWLGNAMGVLIVSPVLLTWSARFNPHKWSFRRLMEAGIVLLFGVGISLVVFSNLFISGQVNLAFVYLPFPILMWSALRFGPSGAATINLAINAIAVLGTVNSRGPFVGTTFNESLFLLWAFVGIASATGLVAAAITAERQQAETAMRRAEKAYRTLVERSLQGIAVLQHGRVVFANSAVADMSGYALEELYTFSSEEVIGLIHPDDRDQVRQIIEARLAGQSVPAHQEYRFIRKDGTLRWVFSLASAIKYREQPAIQIVYVDISERKQIEVQLRHERNFSTAVIDSLPGAFYLFNEQGQFLRWNKNMEAVTGYTAAEIAAMHPLDLFVGDDKQRIAEAIQQVFEKEEATIEANFVLKDGSSIPYLFTGWRIILNDVPCVVGLGIDISTQVQAEAALRQSEQRYRLFIEQSPIGVQVFNPDGVLIEVNRAWEEMWGAKAEQVVGKFNALSDPQIEKMDLLPFIKRIFAGESVDIPDTLYDPEASGMPGRKRWIRTYAYHIEDQAGMLQNVVVLQEDITEQKQAEEKLKESEANLQAIFNNTLQAFVLFDRRQKIVAFNNVANNWAKAMLNRDLREGDSAEQLFAGLAVNKFPTAFEKTLNGETISRESQVQIAGQNHWFEVNYTPVTVDDGSVVGVCLSVLNITERKRLEEQLHQAQKMEAIGRLAGGIAHDFNNVLTIIAGNCDLALDQLEENNPLQRELEQIKKAGNRATSLTRQLLAFSRQQVLQPTALNLNDVVTEISKMLSRLIGEDIELETRLQQDLNLVKVDPGKVEQVIMNLAVNARDAMPQGGKLTIETANVELDKAYAHRHVDITPGPYVMLALSDNGGGMDAETQARIFEPFFTTKEMGEGTGLGLAMVHGIVNQSGGYIWVYSEPGQGTTFKVYLPQVEQEVVQADQHQPIIPEQAATETILLVEDEPMVRELAYRVLTMEGYTVLQANNAQAALQLSQQHAGPIHLLLTDVIMPGGMSGHQLAEQLALLRVEIEVLYMSGYTDNAIIHHGVLTPGTNFLEKPFTPDALTRKVREVLNNK